MRHAQKNVIMITQIKNKGISRCSECLAVKLFVVKIKKKCGLEFIVTQFCYIESYKTKHANFLCQV